MGHLSEDLEPQAIEQALNRAVVLRFPITNESAKGFAIGLVPPADRSVTVRMVRSYTTERIRRDYQPHSGMQF
jgi:hypothetical protein